MDLEEFGMKSQNHKEKSILLDLGRENGSSTHSKKTTRPLPMLNQSTCQGINTGRRFNFEYGDVMKVNEVDNTCCQHHTA